MKLLPSIRIITLSAALAAFTGLPAIADQPPAANAAAMHAFSQAFADVAAKAKPSVVTVFSEKTVHLSGFQSPFGGLFPFDQFFDDDNSPRPRHMQPRNFKQTGMGSGIILDKEGHILTNHHVIDGTDEVKVKLPDGETYDAEVVGADSRTDVAVLKLKGKLPTDLVPAVLGDSEAMRVGEWVLAVGAPFGFEQTVTAGIISAKGRTQVGDDAGKYQDFIQTDAAINPGNSGGPLLNLQGEVIGINTAIATSGGQSAGVGFAIPIDMVKHIMPELISGGKITRGYLGVRIQDITPELAEQFKFNGYKGSLIGEVEKDTPAGQAGMKVGDVIVRFNGKPIEDTLQLRNIVAETDPGSKVDVVVVRDGTEHTVNVVVGTLPENVADIHHPANHDEAGDRSSEFGLTVEPLTAERAHDLGYEQTEGVLITSVDNDSPAAEAGLRPGEVIVEANRLPVTNVAEFRATLDKSKAKVLLLVRNKNGNRFVVLTAK